MIGLKREFRKKWLEAMRDPEWEKKKGQSFLLYKDNNGDEKYCALGVACHLSGIEKQSLMNICVPGMVGDQKEKFFNNFCRSDHPGERAAFLQEIMKQNDNNIFNITFSQIADYIEKNTMPI